MLELRKDWWMYAVIGGAFGLLMFLMDKTSPWFAFPIVGATGSMVLGLLNGFFWTAKKLHASRIRDVWFLGSSFAVLIAGTQIPEQWNSVLRAVLQICAMAIAIWFGLAGNHFDDLVEKGILPVKPGFRYGTLLAWVGLFFLVMPKLLPAIIWWFGLSLMILNLSKARRKVSSYFEQKFASWP